MIILGNQIICDAAVQKIDIKIENNLSQACFSNQGVSYPRPFKMLCAQWVAKDPVSSCRQRRLWSDWADAWADPSLH